MAELHDSRTKLTPLGYQVVDAESRNTGLTHSEIIRDVIHAWALQRVAHAEMIVRLARGCEGLVASATTHQSPEGE